MASIEWIKLSVHLFENAKIRYLKERFGKEAVLLWVYLLTLAGKRNDAGRLMISDNIAYSVRQLARDFEIRIPELRRILRFMEEMGMIENMNGCIVICGWNEHQSAEKLQLIREQTRLRVAKYRAKNKEKCNVTDSVTVTLPVTQCNAVEENRKEKNRLEKKRGEESDGPLPQERGEHLSFEELKELYRECCPSLIEYCPLEESRRAEVEMLLEEYPSEYFKKLFNKAQASPFLKGDNPRGWRAGFEWLMRPVNIGKVMVGTYDRADQFPRSDYLSEYQRSSLTDMFEE